MSRIVYDRTADGELVLSGRDRSEILRAVTDMGLAECLRRTKAAKLHRDRVWDICFPSTASLAPVVPIESLAPDTTEPCDRCRGTGTMSISGGGNGDPEWDGEGPCTDCDATGRVPVVED